MSLAMLPHLIQAPNPPKTTKPAGKRALGRRLAGVEQHLITRACIGVRGGSCRGSAPRPERLYSLKTLHANAYVSVYVPVYVFTVRLHQDNHIFIGAPTSLDIPKEETLDR